MKIFHTGDLHIGMQFSGYPDAVSLRLQSAREQVLGNMVDEADRQGCDLFVIAGDLFDHLRVKKSQMERTIKTLEQFCGLVCVLPGNHDYDDGSTPFWREFEERKASNTLLLNRFEPYDLSEYGVDAVVYPAYCHKRHYKGNNLSWICPKEGRLNIGIGHGAVEGLSCDTEGRYFSMSMQALRAAGMDWWLIGHTHVRYPDSDSITEERILNCGTPEPDGWNARRTGNAWIIDTEKGTVNAVFPNQFFFYDLCYEVHTEDDFRRVLKDVQALPGEKRLLRLTLSGNCDAETWEKRQSYYEQLEKETDYLLPRYEALRKNISMEDIQKEFMKESFPYRLLSRLSEDEDAFRLAYELMKETQ
jgi:exonuclease SbcD